MAGEINKLIPLYGELNRIYNDWVTNYAFSFDKQKFITDFYRQHNDTKAFEAAILELILDKQKEQYTLILNSLKIEIYFTLTSFPFCIPGFHLGIMDITLVASRSSDVSTPRMTSIFRITPSLPTTNEQVTRP